MSGARLALGILLTTASYYLGACISIALRAPPAGISTIWPPNAILLAALLLSPPRTWGWYLLTVLPAHVHVVATFQSNVPLFINVVQYSGNMLQVLIAAAALRRLKLAPPRFDDVRNTGWYILIAAVAAPAIATTLTVSVFFMADWVPAYWLAWHRRVLTNSVPALALTPLIVFAVTEGSAAWRRMSSRAWTELGVLIILLLTVCSVAFGGQSGSTQVLPLLLYAILPLFLWSAVRFGFAALSLCILLVTSLSLLYSYVGRGPFVTLARAENVLALQVFLIAISVPVMLLAAMIRERQRTEDALRVSQQRHRMATAAGSVGVWDWDLRSGRVYTDTVIKSLLGLEDNEITDTFNGWAARVHPEDADQARDLAQEHIEGKTPTFESEHRVFHKDGSIRWFLARGVVVERVAGTATRMIGTTTDITERKRTEEALRTSSLQVRELAGRLITAQEEERRRIARDLHDDLNQKVAALSIGISNVRRQIPNPAGEVGKHLKQLHAITSELANDIRELSHEIHPATLEHAGLVPALTSFAAEIHRLEEVTVELSLPDTQDDIPHDVAICVYRVAQESIRNVVRHSGAKRAQIVLSVSAGAITLLVNDEGRGFDVTRMHQKRGLGLISIEERVRLLNGRLDVSSIPGHGTAVRVEIPT